MKPIICLIGDSGSGKTHLMNLLITKYPEIFSVIKKHSTRPLRPGEENAAEIQPGCSETDVRQYDYIYPAYNYLYGFSKSDIIAAQNSGKVPIIIIGNEYLIRELQLDFKNKVCPIYITRPTSDKDFQSALSNQRSFSF